MIGVNVVITLAWSDAFQRSASPFQWLGKPRVGRQCARNVQPSSRCARPSLYPRSLHLPELCLNHRTYGLPVVEGRPGSCKLQHAQSGEA